ncbi:MAG: response regulator [Deltaproteobacteria bacterium]|nr:response regulator [Deltaproteobacteria bacterium]
MKTRVLIVDDEKEFVDLVSERLTMRDYDVTACYSGEEALETVKKYNFDIVVLDILMPGIDGIETLREIKRIKPLTEVILLTGHAAVNTAIEGMRLGAYDYLTKPCEISDLVTKLDKAHDRKAEQEERIRAAKVEDIVSSPRSAL